MTNKKTNKSSKKRTLGNILRTGALGAGMLISTILPQKMNAQDIDFTTTGSAGSSQKYPAIMEHGTVYAYKEVDESRKNPLGIEKYPAKKMKGTTPTVVYTPQEVEGNRVIISNEGKFAKKPEDSTPEYNTEGLNPQGDKLEIITKDFSNLFKTLVIKGSDGMNDTIYYLHRKGQDGTKQNSIWTYKDDVQEIGVTDNGENYYIQSNEIWEWIANKDRTTGSVNDVLNAKYPSQYDLSKPTTGEVQEILEVDEDPAYAPLGKEDKKKKGDGLDWVRLKLGVDAYGGGVSVSDGQESSMTGGASATGALQFGGNGLFIGPYATYTPEFFSSTSNKTESLDTESELMNPYSETYKTTTGEKNTKTTVSYPYEAGLMTTYQIGENSELSLKLGAAKQYKTEDISGSKTVTYTRGNDTLSSNTLYPESESIVRKNTQWVPSGALSFEHYFGNSNWSFGAEAGSKYYDGNFDVSGKFSINYTINRNKSNKKD